MPAQSSSPWEPAQFAYERDVLGYVASATLKGRETSTGLVALHDEKVTRETRHPHGDCHTLTFQLGGASLRRLGPHGTAVEELPVGTVAIQPADVESTWHSEASARWLQFYLPVSLADAWRQESGVRPGHSPHLERRLGITDQRLVAILYRCAIHTASGGGHDSALIDDASTALADVLFSDHAGQTPKRSEVSQRTRLSARVLRDVAEFIEENLGNGVTASSTANSLGMSRFHFSRAFASTTGISPYAYVQSRRLQQAKTLLATTEQSLADIAHAVGYSSQAHMTTSFARVLGVSPANLRKLGLGRKPSL